MVSKEEIWKWDGNKPLPRLTHSFECDRGQAMQDRVRAGKRGGGGPIVPPMPTTRDGKETINSLVLHKLGQGQVGILKERPQQRGSRQVKSWGRLTVDRKLEQEKSCTGSGLHLPVPPNCGTPG